MKASDAQFTPGPWKVEPNGGDFEVTADSYLVAAIHNANQSPVNKANAALIAAAPDLFAASYEALRVLRRLQKGSGTLRRINAALNKSLDTEQGARHEH